MCIYVVMYLFLFVRRFIYLFFVCACESVLVSRLSVFVCWHTCLCMLCKMSGRVCLCVCVCVYASLNCLLYLSV